MLAQERYEYINRMLFQKKTIKVSHLVRLLNVSGETIRRDLEYLEKEGLLIRIYGGASLAKMETDQGAFIFRSKRMIQEKEEIAQIAVNYVMEGQSILLDHSTTCLIFAGVLKQRFQALTIITNSMEILREFSNARGFRIIFCGGMFNHDELSCFGEHALEIIRNVNVDTAFISVGGISLIEGCTETFFEGADMLRAMLNAAQRKIVLVDNSKFDRATLVKVCDLSDVDFFITDSKIKEKVIEKYAAHDIEIKYQLEAEKNRDGII